jgi:SPP1 gp7 family putative phage head morphogenesis protein
MAEDRSAAEILNEVMKRLAKRWLRRFEREAPKLGAWFAKASTDRSDASMKAALRKAGMSVKFQTTPAQMDAVQAVLAENVSLIKSIASENLTQVQGILSRSVAQGRDLGAMAKELQAQFGVTKRRAALIARDQNNKASAVIVKTRQQELGITHATWQHSHGGKHPRPEHLKASGKVYEIDKGMFLEGKWVWPGTEINCRCVSRSIIPGLERS